MRAGNRDGINDCTRTVGVGGSATAVAGTAVDTGVPLFAACDGYRIDNDYQTVRRPSRRPPAASSLI